MVGSRAVFSGRLRDGDTSESLVEDGSGLQDAMFASFLLIVRGHGEPVPTMVDEQILTVGGAREAFDRPNECRDYASALFPGGS